MKSADEGAKTQSEGAGKEERKVVVQSVAARELKGGGGRAGSERN